MTSSAFVSPDEIRSRFSRAMSDMYRSEVPQYGTLLDIVGAVNATYLAENPTFTMDLARYDNLDRINLERHGAIRLGTASELSTMRRLFKVMGMEPVGYYDLSVAGVPVHSTAFRPVSDESLARNPFRVFTSLLRLELITDPDLRAKAADILVRRQIFTAGAMRLIDQAEAAGGLSETEADRFVAEALETFRWHSTSIVDADTYNELQHAHRLIADVVCFKGPHINHLTPRTLDIDQVQALMPRYGIAAKAVIEGPPTRTCPILLRQTSFKALEEAIAFPEAGGARSGTHTARFGEIEQRGIALTRKGRAVYDSLLASVRNKAGAGDAGTDYTARLAAAFADFPDDYETMRAEGLGFFRYTASSDAQPAVVAAAGGSLSALLKAHVLTATPIVYEDFLPVSAAGIFQSNLGGKEQRSYEGQSNRAAFVTDLGADMLDEFTLYESAERASLEASCALLGLAADTLTA